VDTNCYCFRHAGSLVCYEPVASELRLQKRTKLVDIYSGGGDHLRNSPSYGELAKLARCQKESGGGAEV